MSDALLPAVVLGIDTPIGLAIVRDLGAHGVQVVGLGRKTSALGMYSRYLHEGMVRADGEAALIDQLCALAGRLGRACLFAISEGDIALLNRHRARLSGFQLMFADAGRMDRVLNKEQTYAAAATVGVRVPRTEQIAGMAELTGLAASLRYPVVLKWANPNEVIRVLSGAGLALDKTHYCYSAAQLIAYLAPYEAVGIYPLIQEYCAGYGLGQFVLMRGGVAHYAFQHRRVHEWPPEGGFSSLCESVALSEHAELMTKSIALLRELDWEGIAMVEYRHDPATGESALMEINGRFWGSLPLAWHAGACFPWLSYCLLGTGATPADAPYRSGLRCRFMVPETKRLLRILFQKNKIADKNVSFRRLPELAGYLADFVRPGTCYYVFDTRDPKPFFGDIGSTLRAMAQRLTGREPTPAQGVKRAKPEAGQ
jgi:predicted ATP-grasp superfamily ATP-dependent carboligase